MFICRDLEGNQGRLVGDLGFELFYLSSKSKEGNQNIANTGYGHWLPVTELEDAADTQSIVEKHMNVRLIVDHYSLGFAWEKALKAMVLEIIVIDDLRGRRHYCDYFINPSIIEFDNSTFQDTLPAACTQILGPKYSLLDPSYSALNIVRRNNQPADVKNIFISFGGIDRDGWTCKILEILSLDKFKHYNLEIVVGGGFDSLDHLKVLAAARGRVKIHYQISNVQDVISKCDIAIGAGGTMSWERLCLGVPSVILGIAENQYEMVNELLAKGLCVGTAAAQNASQDYVLFLIRYLIDNLSLRQAISDNGKQYIDGKGLQRVVNILSVAFFKFRDVSMKDAESIFQWRNHESVASVSTTRNTSFDFQDHLIWLKSTLKDKNKILVIAEVNGAPAGVCRFDLLDSTAVISIYSVPNDKKYGGLIKAASSWFFANFPKIQHIRAKVLADNGSSQRSFVNANYQPTSIHYKLDAPTTNLEYGL